MGRQSVSQSVNLGSQSQRLLLTKQIQCFGGLIDRWESESERGEESLLLRLRNFVAVVASFFSFSFSLPLILFLISKQLSDQSSDLSTLCIVQL